MSLFSRITGVLESFQAIELDEKDRFGADGENEVHWILRRGGWRFVRNPLVPHPTRTDVFLESDFLVHSGNALIALEAQADRRNLWLDENCGWLSQTRFRGLERVDFAGYLVAAAYNLVRLVRLSGQPTPA